MSTILFLNQLMFYLKCADAANSANSRSISNGTSLFLSLRKKDKFSGATRERGGGTDSPSFQKEGGGWGALH